MFTGPVGPVEVFFYWPEAVFENFYWPGAIGLPLASSPEVYMYDSTADAQWKAQLVNYLIATYFMILWQLCCKQG